MFSYIELAFAWLLFLSLPLLATGMFYRARKYYPMCKKGLAEEALDSGTKASWRLLRFSFILNVSAGIALCIILATVLLHGLAFITWSGSAAVVVWSYCIATLALERMRRKELVAPARADLA